MLRGQLSHVLTVSKHVKEGIKVVMVEIYDLDHL